VSSLPSAPPEYNAAVLQRIINVITELQIANSAPRGKIAMVDVDDGSQKIIRVNAGVVEAVDP
jgi:hypothetical protein